MPLKKKPSSSDDAGACANCERVEPKMSSCARCGLVKYWLFRAATPFTGRASRAFGREGWPKCAPLAAESCPLALFNSLRKPFVDTLWWKPGSGADKHRGQRCQRLTSER